VTLMRNRSDFNGPAMRTWVFQRPFDGRTAWPLHCTTSLWRILGLHRMLFNRMLRCSQCELRLQNKSREIDITKWFSCNRKDLNSVRLHHIIRSQERGKCRQTTMTCRIFVEYVMRFIVVRGYQHTRFKLNTGVIIVQKAFRSKQVVG
jgi:hypothetical protein